MDCRMKPEESVSCMGPRLEQRNPDSRTVRVCFLANLYEPHTAKCVNHFSSIGYEVHVISFEDARGISPDVVIHKLTTRWRSNLRYFTVTDQLKRIIGGIQPAL